MLIYFLWGRGNYQQGSNADPRNNLGFNVQGSVETGNPFMGIAINYRLHSEFDGFELGWEQKVDVSSMGISVLGGDSG